MKKNLIIYIITIVLSVFYIVLLSHFFCKDLDLFPNSDDMVKAKVIEITDINLNEYKIGNDTHNQKTIYFKAKILSGENKGEIVEAIQQLNDLYAGGQEEIITGKKVLLMEMNEINEVDYIMTEYVRTDSLFVLGLIFIIFLVVFGHKKGINTIVALIFTCLAIFVVFIPAILSGHNIYLWSIITCLFIIVMTLLLINSISKKTLCSMIGCIGGVILTALLTIVMTKIMHLTGFIDDQSYYLQLADTSKSFDLKAMIFGGIIIGAVGAIMDVAVSLSASLLEVYEKANDYDKNVKSLMKSGITIGRDMMGTMSNTLVMAYIGSSLSTTLLLLIYSGSLMELLNREMIIVELLQIMVGSFGLLLTIPLTSLICSIIYCKGAKNN